MTHKFIIELTDDVKGYEDGVDYLERIYGAEEITDNEIYNQALEDFKNTLERHQMENWTDNLEYGITFADVEEVIKQLKK